MRRGFTYPSLGLRAGMKCQKRLYLETYRPELAVAADEFEWADV
jgi:hypothetical protein